jgi:hypothetical protein
LVYCIGGCNDLDWLKVSLHEFSLLVSICHNLESELLNERFEFHHSFVEVKNREISVEIKSCERKGWLIEQGVQGRLLGQSNAAFHIIELKSKHIGSHVGGQDLDLERLNADHDFHLTVLLASSCSLFSLFHVLLFLFILFHYWYGYIDHDLIYFDLRLDLVLKADILNTLSIH